MNTTTRSLTTAALLGALALASGAPAAAADDPAREALRRRIDFSESAIQLKPEIGTASATADTRAAFEGDTFVKALHAVAGTVSFAAVTDPEDFGPPETAKRDGAAAEKEDRSGRFFAVPRPAEDELCGVLRGRTEAHDLEIRLDDLTVRLRDRGDYDPTRPETATDAGLLEDARRLLGGLGAVDRETSSFEVATLMAGTRPETASTAPGVPPVEIETRRLGKKVFLRRVLGGVEVAGQKAIASFQLDGELRKLRARWTPIDYRRSQLGSTLTTEAFVERALDVLLERGVPTDSGTPIYLSTYFRTEPLTDAGGEQACGVSRVDLRGLVIVGLRGPDDSERYAQFDFDV
jgi:hypothetical protein